VIQLSLYFHSIAFDQPSTLRIGVYARQQTFTSLPSMILFPGEVEVSHF
jgi:hypothetical protein